MVLTKNPKKKNQVKNGSLQFDCNESRSLPSRPQDGCVIRQQLSSTTGFKAAQTADWNLLLCSQRWPRCFRLTVCSCIALGLGRVASRASQTSQNIFSRRVCGFWRSHVHQHSSSVVYFLFIFYQRPRSCCKPDCMVSIVWQLASEKIFFIPESLVGFYYKLIDRSLLNSLQKSRSKWFISMRNAVISCFLLFIVALTCGHVSLNLVRCLILPLVGRRMLTPWQQRPEKKKKYREVRGGAVINWACRHRWLQ